MKVTSVKPYLVHPCWRKNWLFVKVETDSGIHGWGEAYTQADRDRTTAIHIEEIERVPWSAATRSTLSTSRR